MGILQFSAVSGNRSSQNSVARAIYSYLHLFTVLYSYLQLYTVIYRYLQSFTVIHSYLQGVDVICVLKALKRVFVAVFPSSCDDQGPSRDMRVMVEHGGMPRMCSIPFCSSSYFTHWKNRCSTVSRTWQEAHNGDAARPVRWSYLLVKETSRRSRWSAVSGLLGRALGTL